MSARISRSLLDPLLTAPLRRIYPWIPIPARFPPEAIVACGHLAAIAGAVGFAASARSPWGGVAGALGVALNHVCDVLDGTHARATGQCRNGGELLDHFVDPLSFCYWVAGLSFSVLPATSWAPWIGMIGVIVIYAMAVLTNIRAKMIGEFTLARFGPTEFKTLLILFGLAQAWLVGSGARMFGSPPTVALWFLAAMTVAGVAQLLRSLWRAVRDVNDAGAAKPDTTEWHRES